MSKPLVIVAAICVAALAAGAYWLATGGLEAKYTGVEELVADLEENGVDCRKLVVSPPEQTEEVGAEFGFCFIGEKNVNIHVYEDDEGVEEHVAGNLSVRGDDPNYFTSLVQGSNWVVDTYSEESSRRVQEALGGEIK